MSVQKCDVVPWPGAQPVGASSCSPKGTVSANLGLEGVTFREIPALLGLSLQVIAASCPQILPLQSAGVGTSGPALHTPGASHVAPTPVGGAVGGRGLLAAPVHAC